MLVRTSIVTGFAAILLSTAAFADTATTTTPPTKPAKQKETTQQLTDRCAALATQFDQAITTHGTAPKASAAKQLRTKGETLCKSNHQTTGIKNLQQALKDLGLKPNA